MDTKKGMKPLDLDATGIALADAVRWHRLRQNISYSELEDRLDQLGHRIPALGLRRIESRARRVDVDDLMALSAALDVSPMKMLLHVPADAPTPEYQVATGLPSDFSLGELTAWIRGESGITLPARISYWSREIQRLEDLTRRDAQRLDELRREYEADRENVTLRERVRWAEGDLVADDRDLAAAIRRHEELLQRHRNEATDGQNEEEG